jgi:uncharacterized protein (DUF1499 family)
MNKHITLVMITAGLLMMACASESKDMSSEKFRNPLPECPESPNCIRYTFAVDEGRSEVMGLLQQALEHMNVNEMESSDDAIDAVFRIPVFGWKDDVNIRLETAGSGETLIHMRSASRVGYSDLGVNRMRVKKIRSEYFRARKAASLNR